MTNLSPVAAKIARFNLSHGNPTAGVDFHAATCTLTLANGERVDLSLYGDVDAAVPANFGEACGWWSAIKAGRPLPVIERRKVVTREITKLMQGFSPATLERLLAAAQDLEEGEWTRHFQAQRVRDSVRVH